MVASKPIILFKLQLVNLIKEITVKEPWDDPFF